MTFDPSAMTDDRPAQSGAGGGLLRLIAMDDEDLAILSAHLQDAQVRVRDLAYLPEQRRFALAGKRFDWVKAASGGCERCEIGLHFEYVLGVTRTGFVQTESERLLNLLAVEYQETDAPGGEVRLIFSGGAAVRLRVECLEAQMRDLGGRWPCDCRPAHP